MAGCIPFYVDKNIKTVSLGEIYGVKRNLETTLFEKIKGEFPFKLKNVTNIVKIKGIFPVILLTTLKFCLF